MTPLPALTATRSRAPLATRLGALLLGSDPVQRRGVLRWALMVQAYAVGLILLGVGVHLGRAPQDAALFLVAYCALGMGVFYAALRSGWSLLLDDPLLTFPMALFAVSAIVLSYGLTELSRAASLQLLFVLVVFQMHLLSPGQTSVIAYGAVGLLLVLVGAMAWSGQPGFDLQRELFNIVMAAAMLPTLAIVAREVRRQRRKQMEQRGELQKTLDHLRDLSIRDPLTGLFNRRHVLEMLEDEAQRQTRTGSRFCVAIIDLDHFKRINDHFGHLAGDAVLRDFAHIAGQTLRTVDVIGRWGGEEFVVLIHDADIQRALLAMERLRQAVAEHDWSVHASGLCVTFSAGVCAHEPAQDLNQSLERADRALYAAKAGGRDRALPADAAMLCAWPHGATTGSAA